MNVEYINNSRSRMVEHPYLLNMFDLGFLKHSGIFDAGSISPRAASIEFLVDYFHIYHYDI